MLLETLLAAVVTVVTTLTIAATDETIIPDIVDETLYYEEDESWVGFGPPAPQPADSMYVYNYPYIRSATYTLEKGVMYLELEGHFDGCAGKTHLDGQTNGIHVNVEFYKKVNKTKACPAITRPFTVTLILEHSRFKPSKRIILTINDKPFIASENQ